MSLVHNFIYFVVSSKPVMYTVFPLFNYLDMKNNIFQSTIHQTLTGPLALVVVAQSSNNEQLLTWQSLASQTVVKRYTSPRT